LQKQKKILLISVLSILFIISLVRIVFFIEQVSRQSMQMDFTAYYTAGKVMNLGLSPYNNYIAQDWLLWDGVAQFKHSRFLYPPIAGSFFQPIAKLDYSTAKHLWNYLNFFFVTGAVFLWLKFSGFDKNIFAVLIAGIFMFNFFPFYTLLERGQIDGLTFLLLTAGIFLIRKQKNIAAGIFFAVASVFKFYCLLIIPFLLLKKKFSTAISFIVCSTTILSAMYILNGTPLVNDYLFNQLPRISEFAESGTEEMKIDSWILKNYFTISRYSISLIDGQPFVSESISFFSKASLIKVITAIQSKAGLNLSSTFWSAILFVLILFLFGKNIRSYSALYQWSIILLVILICSPFTWVMNLVWLLPVLIVIFHLFQTDNYKNIFFVFILCGLMMVSFPDNYKTNNFLLDGFLKSRHVIGELLILTGMLLLPKLKNFKTLTSESWK
jgi:hypothetical protein